MSRDWQKVGSHRLRAIGNRSMITAPIISLGYRPVRSQIIPIIVFD
jgi:hypothetical protein